MPTGHYDRQIRAPLSQRLMSKVTKTDSCWLFNGNLNDRGYGRIRRNRGRLEFVQRVAYEIFIGSIPPDMEIDHLCRVRNCVNPSHLEAVSHKENIHRGNGLCAINRRKTQCYKGHKFDAENTYLPPKGGRVCKACTREKDAKYRIRQRLADMETGSSVGCL